MSEENGWKQVKTHVPGSVEKAQLVKSLGNKPDDLNLVTETLMVGSREPPPRF